LATEIEDADTSRRLVRMLAEAAGLEGMVAGQQDDLDGEGKPGLGLRELESIHARKTGALIAAALQSGAVVAGAEQRTVGVCGEYGRELGLAFQVADDILDLTATAEQLGKSPGKDVAAGKLTYPGLLGIDGARAQAQRLAGEAAALAAQLPKGDVLASLAWYVVSRGN
jgi:farnesyl diphosphate synthase